MEAKSYTDINTQESYFQKILLVIACYVDIRITFYNGCILMPHHLTWTC